LHPHAGARSALGRNFRTPGNWPDVGRRFNGSTCLPNRFVDEGGAWQRLTGKVHLARSTKLETFVCRSKRALRYCLVVARFDDTAANDDRILNTQVDVALNRPVGPLVQNLTDYVSIDMKRAWKERF
jgi:hypothetical protein